MAKSEDAMKELMKIKARRQKEQEFGIVYVLDRGGVNDFQRLYVVVRNMVTGVVSVVEIIDNYKKIHQLLYSPVVILRDVAVELYRLLEIKATPATMTSAGSADLFASGKNAEPEKNAITLNAKSLTEIYKALDALRNNQSYKDKHLLIFMLCNVVANSPQFIVEQQLKNPNKNLNQIMPYLPNELVSLITVYAADLPKMSDKIREKLNKK